MKKFREKLANLLGWIYGIGITLSLFVGAATLLGYIAALIIGGDVAQKICEVIYKGIYPVIFYISSGSVLVGLVKMYVAGEKSLSASKKKEKTEK